MKEQKNKLDPRTQLVTDPEGRADRLTFVFFIIDKLKNKGSWCSLLHIQKACYMARQMLGVPLNYEFIRYKHGPYCFKLTDEIDAARNTFLIYSDEIIAPDGFPFALYQRVKDCVAAEEEKGYEYIEYVNFIADWFGNKQGRQLELLTSIYMVMGDLKKCAIQKKEINSTKSQSWKSDFTKTDIKTAIAETQKWKPHFEVADIEDAIEEIEDRYQAQSA